MKKMLLFIIAIAVVFIALMQYVKLQSEMPHFSNNTGAARASIEKMYGTNLPPSNN
jgi:hypothetical protein